MVQFLHQVNCFNEKANTNFTEDALIIVIDSGEVALEEALSCYLLYV